MNQGKKKADAAGSKVLIAGLVGVTLTVAAGYFGSQAHRTRASAAAVEAAPAGATPVDSAAAVAQPAPAREAIDEELLRSALGVQMTVRSQLELYKLQHADKAPDLITDGWAAMVARTAENGTVSERGQFGPYFESAPVNPLNKRGNVALVGGRAEGTGLPVAESGSAPAGFLFETRSGRIWLTDPGGTQALDEDAAVRDATRSLSPRPTSSAQTTAQVPLAKARALESTLRMLRMQIELYKLQHGDAAPDLQRHPNWAQLVQSTDADGAPRRRARFGPYLEHVPSNPLNGLATVWPVKKMPAAGAKASDGKRYGFYYEQGTGRVAATDANGDVFPDGSLRLSMKR